MNRFARAILAASALLAGPAARGLRIDAINFDPTDIFGSATCSTPRRRCRASASAVFPEGVPGVPQGVPPELVKGNQAAAEPETTQPVTAQKEATAEEKAKAEAQAETEGGRQAGRAGGADPVTVRRSDPRLA